MLGLAVLTTYVMRVATLCSYIRFSLTALEVLLCVEFGCGKTSLPDIPHQILTIAFSFRLTYFENCFKNPLVHRPRKSAGLSDSAL